MSAGPEPDLNGTLTISEPCAACSGGAEGSGDPQRDQDYGNRSVNVQDGGTGQG